MVTNVSYALNKQTYEIEIILSEQLILVLHLCLLSKLINLYRDGSQERPQPRRQKEKDDGDILRDQGCVFVERHGEDCSQVQRHHPDVRQGCAY